MASFQLAQLIIIPDSSGREELHVGSIALVLGHLEQVPWGRGRLPRLLSFLSFALPATTSTTSACPDASGKGSAKVL